VVISQNSKQMISGKAFEYALLRQFEEKLKKFTILEVIKNSAFIVAKDCFDSVGESEKSAYLLYASFAVNFLMDIEPRLSNDLGEQDILQLEILTDQQGEAGDVRDVLAIRALQKWEIGVSAKNNHKAVKHSRLSADIDFGMKWLGMPVSDKYFNAVTPVFNELKRLRKESGQTKKWKDLGDYHDSVYKPILIAFINELKNLYKIDSEKVASNLIRYLIGNKDFYKVFKGKNTLEIHAYNLQGTLNLPFQNILPKYVTPKVMLPTEIVNIDFKEDSGTTVIVSLNHGWGLSFRIHNASSRVEPSLKFDINLIDAPKSLFRNTLSINERR